jgi:hypothetical protein
LGEAAGATVWGATDVAAAQISVLVLDLVQALSIMGVYVDQGQTHAENGSNHVHSPLIDEREGGRERAADVAVAYAWRSLASDVDAGLSLVCQPLMPVIMTPRTM